MVHGKGNILTKHIHAMTEVIITIASSFVTALVTWIFARRKNNADARKVEAEAKQGELDVIEDAIKIWREIAEDLKKEVKRLSDDNKQLKSEVHRLRQINTKILIALDKITTENAAEIISKLKNEIQND